MNVTAEPLTSIKQLLAHIDMTTLNKLSNKWRLFDGKISCIFRSCYSILMKGFAGNGSLKMTFISLMLLAECWWLLIRQTIKQTDESRLWVHKPLFTQY